MESAFAGPGATGSRNFAAPDPRLRADLVSARVLWEEESAGAGTRGMLGAYFVGKVGKQTRRRSRQRKGAAMQFIEYPSCSTCRKAKAWLDAHGATYDDRHIVEDAPSADELGKWRQASGLPAKRFFNTSGKRYRELELSKKLPSMTDEQMFELLATDGMLVKRPLLVLDDTVLVGFKEAEWEQALGMGGRA